MWPIGSSRWSQNNYTKTSIGALMTEKKKKTNTEYKLNKAMASPLA